tara:strand:- start:2482 stop:3447 length:966 start_codon:yes stop_codon:yes gene_type:complete
VAKIYGKNINLKKQHKKNAPTGIKSLNLKGRLGFNRILNGSLKSRGQFTPPAYVVDSSTTFSNVPQTSRNFKSDRYSNPFYNYLMDNSISRLTTPLIYGTVLSFDIVPTGVDNLIRKGDTFYLYHPYSFEKLKLTSDVDMTGTTSSFKITSTTISRGLHRFPAGSFLVLDNRLAMQRLSGCLNYKKFELTNAEYTSLNSSPYTLLAAETGFLHIPTDCCIQYIRSADEMSRYSLYIGHDTSTSIGDYWGSIGSFAYRERNNLLYQMNCSTYSASGVYSTGYPLKQSGDDGTGDALKLYTSINPTSSSHIVVHLWYKSLYVL